MAFSAALAGLWQDIFELDAGSPGIRVGSQGQLLGDDFADIEHISDEGLRRIGLGVQHRLPAFGIQIVGHVLLEDDAEGVIEVLGHWIQAEHAGLHDPATQTAFDNHLSAGAPVDGHPGRKRRQPEEAETLGQSRTLGVAGRDLEGGPPGSHAVEIDDSLYL